MSPATPAAWRVAVAEPSALGESPFWHPHEQMLYWVDIVASQVCRANILMGLVQRWALPQTPGCIAPAARGGLVLGLRDGIYRAAEWGGALARLCALPGDPSRLRFNDGKADPAGHFWAGTYAEQKQQPEAALYCLDATRHPPALQVVRSGFFTSNGLAWSPDGATMYWADTQGHRIHAWACDAQTHMPGPARVFHELAAKPPGWQPGQPGYAGRPDGAAVDSEGNYWCALYEGARLRKLSPTGQVLADYAVPAQCPTMPCFGGDDLRTLYLTTARQGRPEAELAAWPHSGCVLSMRVDVPGLPVNFFSG